MPKRLLVVGSINLDLVASSQRIPLPGETVSGKRLQHIPRRQRRESSRRRRKARRAGQHDRPHRQRRLRHTTACKPRSCERGHESGRSRTDLIWHRAHHHRGGRTKRNRRRARSERRTVAARTGKTSPAHPRSRNHSDAARNPARDDRDISRRSCAAKIFRSMLDPAPARALPASLLASVDWLTPNETETLTLLQRKATELNSSERHGRRRATTPETRLPQRPAQTRRTRLLRRPRLGRTHPRPLLPCKSHRYHRRR